jgi:hypothetical protein
VWQLRRNPEAGEPYVAGGVDEHVRRLDVLMDKAASMDCEFSAKVRKAEMGDDSARTYSCEV